MGEECEYMRVEIARRRWLPPSSESRDAQAWEALTDVILNDESLKVLYLV